MKLRALLIDDQARTRIALVAQKALANPVSRERLERMVAGEEPPVGDSADHVVQIPDGYRCVYSVEDQPMGRVRHLSVSVRTDEPGVGPSPESVGAIMREFGFSSQFALAVGQRKPQYARGLQATAWVEEGRAINLVERV